MKSQVLAMKEAGFGFKTIARALGISKNTVKVICHESENSEAIRTEVNEKTPLAWQATVPWEEALKEYRKGVTVKQLHKDYGPAVGYTGFRRELQRRGVNLPRASIPLLHKAGEKAQVDFTDGIPFFDERSEERRTQLFVAVLPHSSKVFAHFVENQRLESFIEAHDAMWSFFGGVTRYVVIDNLKAGVTKAHRYDPEENKTYCEYANHMGFAVLPTRPRSPRDKGAVENAVGVLQRTFFQEVRHRRFVSLGDLNRALREFLVRFNAEIMKDYGVSRDERFETERPKLQPLPALPFELKEWREAKVHPDCEVQVDKNFYSVPYVLIGKKVRVALGARLVEIFDMELGRVTSHPRLAGQGRHSRYDWHYPHEQLQLARYEVRHAQEEAAKVGPQTKALVDKLFEGSWPLRGLRRAQGVLRVGQVYGHEALEHAASVALQFGKLRVDYVKSCARSFSTLAFQEGIDVRTQAPRRDSASVFLHGVPMGVVQ